MTSKRWLITAVTTVLVLLAAPHSPAQVLEVRVVIEGVVQIPVVRNLGPRFAGNGLGGEARCEDLPVRRRPAWILATVVVVVAGFLATRAWFPGSIEPGYSVVGEWGGAGDGPGRFNGPIGVAVGVGVGHDDRIFVADMDNDRVQKFTADGKFLVAVEAGFDRPTDVAEAADGSLYVTDFGHDRVVRMVQDEE